MCGPVPWNTWNICVPAAPNDQADRNISKDKTDNRPRRAFCQVS